MIEVNRLRSKQEHWTFNLRLERIKQSNIGVTVSYCFFKND